MISKKAFVKITMVLDKVYNSILPEVRKFGIFDENNFVEDALFEIYNAIDEEIRAEYQTGIYTYSWYTELIFNRKTDKLLSEPEIELFYDKHIAKGDKNESSN